MEQMRVYFLSLFSINIPCSLGPLAFKTRGDRCGRRRTRAKPQLIGKMGQMRAYLLLSSSLCTNISFSLLFPPNPHPISIFLLSSVPPILTRCVFLLHPPTFVVLNLCGVGGPLFCWGRSFGGLPLMITDVTTPAAGTFFDSLARFVALLVVLVFLHP